MTNYKRVIKLNKLDELNLGKPLNTIVKENQGVKIVEEPKVKENSDNSNKGKLPPNLEKKFMKEVKETNDKIAIDKKMIEDIERQKNDAENLGAGRYEYFLDGKWQTYIPFHAGGERDPHSPSADVLSYQNRLLRLRLDEKISKYQKEHKLKLKVIQSKCNIVERRNIELNAQINSLLNSKGLTLNEELSEAYKRIILLKKENEKVKEDLGEKIHGEYKAEIEGYKTQIDVLKGMLMSCEEKRKSSMARSSKKYDKMESTYWKNRCAMLEEENRELRAKGN